MSTTEQFDAEVPETAQAAPRGFLPILWQRKALVLLGLVLGLAGGFLFYWQREPVYQANATMLVIKRHSAPLGGMDPLKQAMEDFMGTHVVVLRSPLIVRKALEKKGLGSLKTFEEVPDPAGMILSGLSVNRDPKEPNNNVLYLAFRGPVPEDCGKVLTALIDAYQEYMDKQFRDLNDDTLERVMKAAEKGKLEWKKSEERQLKFLDDAPVGADGLVVVKNRIDEIEKKRSQHIIHQDELKARIQFIEVAIKEGKGAESLAALARSGEAALKGAEKLLNEQLLPLELLEETLTQKYEAEHPEVKSVRARIAKVKALHNKTFDDPSATKDPVQRQLNILREELRHTEGMLKLMENNLAQLNVRAREMKRYVMQEENLKNEVLANKDEYDVKIKQLKQMGFSGGSGFNTSVLAQSGGVKVAPSAVQTIAGGGMIGLLLGVALAFLADFTDKGFRSPDEVRRRLRLPLLGHVPFLKPDPEVQRKLQSGEVQIDPLLYSWFRSKSLEAEAFRAIRTALLFSLQGQGHRVIQVTSPSKGDGKSLVVGNLAISIAQSDKKVLVIDADCRRPRQNKIFGLPNTKGLVNVIKQEATWRECAVQTPVEGLWIMPSGPIPPNPAELLTSPVFKQLLEETREQFDLVIVDTPPLLAVTDPCIVAGKVDGVMLVLRLSRQGRPNAERAVEIMKSLKVNVLGLIVNGITRQSGAGIYNSEHYDYSESYTESESVDHEEGYYYYEEDAEEAAPAADQPDKSDGAVPSGFWGRMFSRKG